MKKLAKPESSSDPPQAARDTVAGVILLPADVGREIPARMMTLAKRLQQALDARKDRTR